MEKILIAIVVVLSGLIGAYTNHRSPAQPVVGSIISGQEYNATSTDSTWASATAIKTLKAGPGQLGSIVVASSSAAVITPYSLACYDSSVSTTTASTTLIKIAGTAVAGTYQVDAVFNAGLKCDAPSGFAGNYTITWK